MKSASEQVAEAYGRMATEARYRPAAPSDGLGNIVMPEAELVLGDESAEYARQWMSQEDEGNFSTGYPDHPGRPALVFTIEAARLICGVTYEPAAQLLRMAAAELDRLAVQQQQRDA